MTAGATTNLRAPSFPLFSAGTVGDRELWSWGANLREQKGKAGPWRHRRLGPASAHLYLHAHGERI